MTRIRSILLLCVMMCFPVVISAQDEGKISSPVVLVEKYQDAYQILAEGEGAGPTLEFAKFAAINSILPQLVCETGNLPGVSKQNLMSMNDKVMGQGIDRMAAQTRIEGYWQLENGVYRYFIKLMMKSEKEENE